MSEALRAIVESYLGPGRLSGEGWISFRCPFHKDGKERNASFAVNLTSGWSKCWSCPAGGPLEKLLADLGASPRDVASTMLGVKGELVRSRKEAGFKIRTAGIGHDRFKAPVALPETLLQAYQGVPHPLISKGFSAEWLEYLQIRVDESLHRIVYPVRDLYGSLAGCVGGRLYQEQQPKYLVYQGDRTVGPGNRKVSEYGSWFNETYPHYSFDNRVYLWQFERIYPILLHQPSGGYLVIVEGYKACLWLLQSGIPYVAALMGSSLTREQRDQLLRLGVPIVLALDNNPAGISGTLRFGGELHQARGNIYVARYPDEREQLDNLTAEEAVTSVHSAEDFSVFQARHLAQKPGNMPTTNRAI